MISPILYALLGASVFGVSHAAFDESVKCPKCPPGDTDPKCADPFNNFESFAIRSGSPIMYEPLVARDGGIWLGGKVKSSCPLREGPCPIGNTTLVTTNAATGSASLTVYVPGGQLLYVEKNGAVSYTTADHPAIPKNVFISGFGFQPKAHKGDYNYWNFSGAGGSTGFVACPVGPVSAHQWRVYADTYGFKRNVRTDQCLGFEALVNEQYPNAFAGAYQYD